MKVRAGDEYITREELQQAEEQVKRSWKVLLVLLALALRTKPEAPAEVGRGGVEVKPAKPETVAKVLLVNADTTSSQDLKAVLENGGFEVMPYMDANEGLKVIGQASMIILDEGLPDISEVCSRIREQSQVPIILIGADSGASAWQRAEAIGADAYLRRWTSHTELMARLRAIFRRYLKASHPERGGTKND